MSKIFLCEARNAYPFLMEVLESVVSFDYVEKAFKLAVLKPSNKKKNVLLLQETAFNIIENLPPELKEKVLIICSFSSEEKQGGIHFALQNEIADFLNVTDGEMTRIMDRWKIYKLKQKLEEKNNKKKYPLVQNLVIKK
jgi:hypothetical protein